MSNVTLTLPALKRSRSANIGVITRSENAVSAIFNKEASTLTYKEIGTLKANLTMCERKKKELEELNQQISNVQTMMKMHLKLNWKKLRKSTFK